MGYTHRLENEVQFQTKEGGRVKDLVKDSQSKLDTSQEELLRKSGCVCTSPHLELSTTTADHKKKHPETFDLLQQQRGHPSISRCSFTGTTKPSSGCLERLWVGRVAFTSVLPTTVWPSVP